MTEVLLNNSNREFESKGELFKTKIDLLVFLAIASAVFFSWSLKSLLASSSAIDWVVLTLSSLAFLILFIFQALFIKENIFSNTILVLESLGLISFFITISIVPGLVALVIFLFLYAGNSAGRKIVNNTMKIDFWDVSRVTLSKGLVALFVIPSIFVPLFYINNQQFPISSSLFEKVVLSSKGFVEKIMPGVDMSMSLEQIAQKATNDRLAQEEQAKYLKESQKKQLANEATNSLTKQMSDTLGININPSISFASALYEGLKEKFFMQSEEIKNMIFVLIGAVIFLTLASIMWPIRIILSAIAFVFYQILLAFGFAHITLEDKPKEVIIV